MHQEWYKTATYGFDITIPDLCTLVLFIIMIMRSREYRIRWYIPLTIPTAIFLLLAIISWLAIPQDRLSNPIQEGTADRYFLLSLFPLFGIFKVIKFFWIYWVLTNFLVLKDSLKTVIYSFALVVIYLTLISFFERYVQHEFQINGYGMGPNVVSVYIGAIGAFLFPFIFICKSNKKAFFYIFLVFCSFVVVILSVGRSALLGFVLASLVSWVMMITRNLNMRNIVFSIIMAVAAMGLTLKAIQTLRERWNEESIEFSIHDRLSLNLRAVEMANDYFWGVGLGNYPAWFAVKYSGVDQDPINIAHNIYFLTLGELGYLGLITLLCKHIRILQMLISDFVYNRRYILVFTVLVAVTGAWIVIFIQDMVHFTSLINQIAFLTHLMTAFIARIYMDKNWMREIYDIKYKVNLSLIK